MQTQDPLIPASKSSTPAKTKSGMWQMWLIVIIFAAPVVASYITFYFLRPEGGKTNYGQLVYPVQPAPENVLMPVVYGKWTLLIARPGLSCSEDEEHCVKLLFLLRQTRASLGKEMDRVQIVWINTDNSSIKQTVMDAYSEKLAGVKVVPMPTNDAEKKQLLAWLDQDNQKESIQLLDPRGARMMRFAVQPSLPEFAKMRKDIEKLLKWNPTGKHG
jgi:hypothetical protein